MNYKETLDYINSITWLGSKPGLDRIKELLTSLGNPQDNLKFIHIGGTNGKGSTAAMLSSILGEAGYKVGLFTSPYINFFNERMQINNIPISNDELAEIATYVRPYSDEMLDSATEFELNTAIAMEYFNRNKCDIVVLEVGMGGELDSTNIINTPELTIFTSIGLDHINELGGTIEEIAQTKAGIIKEGADVLVYEQEKNVEDIIRQYCKKKNANYNSTEFSKVKMISCDLSGQHFEYDGESYFIKLVGNYQLNNAATVFKAIEILKNKGWNISKYTIKSGLLNTKWPGRFEVMLQKPIFIVDGAHNLHGIKATAASIKKYFLDKKIIFVLGIMADKDINKMLDEVIPLASIVYTVTPDNTRAMPSKELADLIESKKVKAIACESIKEGVDNALQVAGQDGVICAIGSLYMVGDIRAYLLKQEKER